MIATRCSFANYDLLLVAGYKETGVDTQPNLWCVDWLSDDDWRHSKSIEKIRKHHFNTDSEIEFIPLNSLSKDSAVDAFLIDVSKQLDKYFKGETMSFNIPLNLNLGTPFQQRVWQALLNIPYGETISYAQLAQHIHQPTAHRAVANANGKNPFSIIIPCHRVIASDGALGGYTGGVDKKKYLLQLEHNHKPS